MLGKVQCFVIFKYPQLVPIVKPPPCWFHLVVGKIVLLVTARERWDTVKMEMKHPMVVVESSEYRRRVTRTVVQQMEKPVEIFEFAHVPDCL